MIQIIKLVYVVHVEQKEVNYNFFFYFLCFLFK
jgi:hypothetical protein